MEPINICKKIYIVLVGFDPGPADYSYVNYWVDFKIFASFLILFTNHIICFIDIYLWLKNCALGGY